MLTAFNPKTLSTRWGTSPESVLALIHSGKLRVFTLSRLDSETYSDLSCLPAEINRAATPRVAAQLRRELDDAQSAVRERQEQGAAMAAELLTP